MTDDLMILIQEIEEHPDISNWAIRMTLKAIRDKARTVAKQTAQISIKSEKLAS